MRIADEHANDVSNSASWILFITMKKKTDTIKLEKTCHNKLVCIKT